MKWDLSHQPGPDPFPIYFFELLEGEKGGEEKEEGTGKRGQFLLG